MTRQEEQGLSFGMKLILIWLVVLTALIMYDKMGVGEKINKVIILPPPIEELQPIGGYDNEI